MIDPNASAFPSYKRDGHFVDAFPSGGLTKRELFAAMAMQGICADGIPGQHHQYHATAQESVKYADALIAALNKEEL